eukprot:GFUD01010737.1.p1 GENE.GFUD01010737.1~~GFUD01010737.1.p1  ORF type:complete len:703 (-),score=93.22 GFUD01010737.1:369-2477(-)
MDAGSAIMESLDPMMVNGRDQDNLFLSSERQVRCNSSMITSIGSKTSIPDVVTHDLQSLNLHGGADDCRSFLLLDQNEQLSVDSGTSFCTKLGCDASSTGKVISILGNTGEGKSHTLNHTFFNGEEIFATSNQQDSCTSGVWTSFDPNLQVVVLDTEGMLGLASNENIRTRLLLKVLAVSDVVIYRTRAERLHNDLFYFLGDASKAYNKHFKQELNRMGEANSFSENFEHSVSSLGPTVIVFHETLHTDILSKSNGGDPEKTLRERFCALKQDISAFSKIRYVGTRSDVSGRTNFGILREALGKELSDSSIRSQRKITLVYQAFQLLNKKFSGNVIETSHCSFPDEYFTCAAKCQSCESRCGKQMNHTAEHTSGVGKKCIFSVQYENKIYTCQRCQENGRKCVVVPKAASSKEGSIVGLAKFAWSGFVLECQKCGVIYRSRQQWYGNTDPEHQGVVHTEIAHVWPGVRSLQGTQNAARRILDSMTAISGTVSDVSSAPAASLARWAADQVAPAYWRPNADIVSCHNCSKRFDSTDKIHHCRACGEGFCSSCSAFQRPVPERGWGFQAVRVCKPCYTATAQGVLEVTGPSLEPNEVQVRKVGETVYGTVSSLANALEFPISILKDSARPDYWVPDHEISECAVCDKAIGANAPSSQECTRVHHCRVCGQGVCNDCSKTRRPVPTRGWDTSVRVCDDCLMMPED